jgi:hypothetical protein
MKILTPITYIIMLLGLQSCAYSTLIEPVIVAPNNLSGTSDMNSAQSADNGRFLAWGLYNLEIARDGSSASVSRNRNAASDWGVHVNAVKLLEKAPCTDCLTTGNIHLTPDGNVSIDISITHPYETALYTGFDVRGILMFPSSQYFPDDELRNQGGLPPWGVGGNNEWKERFSSTNKGDAVLVNAEGWTKVWAPDTDWYGFKVDKGFPIFGYYAGKFASGDTLGTLNPFRRFHTTETRHMFEIGNMVTETYIIRPPATGPIKASYAVYAHWAPPKIWPVTDPANDFGPEANSPMPYEFWVTQDSPIDPDWSESGQVGAGEPIHIHMKNWVKTNECWLGSLYDLTYECSVSETFKPHPEGKPDDYQLDGFCTKGYQLIPNGLPGEWPYLLRVEIHKDSSLTGLPIGEDYYIFNVAIDKPDGKW